MRLLNAVFTAALASMATASVILSHQKPSNTSQPGCHIEVSSSNNDSWTKRNSPSPATAFWDDDLASPADWEKFTLKGGALICALKGTDQTAGRQIKDSRSPPSAISVWSGNLKQELHDWYWHELNPTSEGCQLDDNWKVPATMRALGLDGKAKSAGGNNVCYRIEHWDPNKEENGRQIPAINQWYQVDGNSYRSTKAHFEFGMNFKGGAIHSFYLDGPKSAAKHNWYGNSKDPDPALLPRLRSLSDILWGYWTRDNPNIKNIRYFLMLGISNDLTNQLIASCLKNAKKELKEWPGASFATDTDEGHALLGSPNGAVFAYFLFQHKIELGYKTISRITVIRPETEDDADFVDASLIFHVVDTPEPPPVEDQGAKMERQHSDTFEAIEQGTDNFVRFHRFVG